jgi:hypothetical protein
MNIRRSFYLLLTLFVLLACTLNACGGEKATTSSEKATTSSVASTSTSSQTSTTTAVTAAATSPFVSDDLRGLVLADADGTGLVSGLLYRQRYSGSAQLSDVRHWTLMPPDRLQALGFVGAWDSIFFTDEFYSKNGEAGTSLLTAALLFDTPQDAAAALKAFADTRDELWADWRPLGAVSGANSIGQTGHLGSDNVTDVYPSTSFALQIGNVCLLVGSQGGSQSGQPVSEGVLRSVAEKLLAGAKSRLA